MIHNVRVLVAALPKESTLASEILKVFSPGRIDNRLAGQIVRAVVATPEVFKVLTESGQVLEITPTSAGLRYTIRGAKETELALGGVIADSVWVTFVGGVSGVSHPVLYDQKMIEPLLGGELAWIDNACPDDIWINTSSYQVNVAFSIDADTGSPLLLWSEDD